MDYDHYICGLTIYFICIIEYPWDGSTSWIFTVINLYKPFMWCRPDARLRHACYLFIVYKPFMWCRLDARLWHALCFIFCYKPFMWCRPDARLRHYYSCSFLSRSHSDTRSVHFFYFRIARPYFLCMRASQTFVYFMADLSS